jgi:hypothetical protein
MTSTRRGTLTLSAEVTNVSPHGLWLLLDDREVFLAFVHFPWFEHASIRDIANVERPSAHHLHWPALDVDLAVESIDHPEAFPLVSARHADKQPRKVGRN